MEKWLSASCEEVGGYILGKVRTMNLSCYFCKLLHGLWLILPTHKGKLGNRGYLLKSKFMFSTFWPWHGILWPTYWNASFQVVLSHRDIFQMFFSLCCPALDSMVQLCNCLLAHWTWPWFPFSLHYSPVKAPVLHRKYACATDYCRNCTMVLRSLISSRCPKFLCPWHSPETPLHFLLSKLFIWFPFFSS